MSDDLAGMTVSQLRMELAKALKWGNQSRAAEIRRLIAQKKAHGDKS